MESTPDNNSIDETTLSKEKQQELKKLPDLTDDHLQYFTLTGLQYYKISTKEGYRKVGIRLGNAGVEASIFDDEGTVSNTLHPKNSGEPLTLSMLVSSCEEGLEWQARQRDEKGNRPTEIFNIANESIAITNQMLSDRK